MSLRTSPVRRTLARAGLALLLASALASAALAGLLDDLLAGLPRASGLSGQRSDPEVAGAAAVLMGQSQPPAGTVDLAAHVGAEGHWTFINRRGEAFTVGTPDEMKRLVAALAPDAPTVSPKLVLYLTGATVFERAVNLADLPAGTELHLVVGAQSFPIARIRERSQWLHYAVVRPRLHLLLSDRGLLDEALRQLRRPVEKRYLRVLALEPGGPRTLPRAPAPDAVTGRPPVDAIDPEALPAALATLRGQTVLVSGRVTGDQLAFRPTSGSELTLDLSAPISAAAGAGTDLVILQSATAQQPRGRNWFWQRFEIGGLDKALGHTTLDAFLEALTAGREPVVVTQRRQGGDRIVLRAQTPGDGLGGVLREVATSITGSVVPTAIEAHLVSDGQRRELALRLIPLVPSTLQAAYIGGLMLGILGLGTARRWWARLWPAEQRSEYGGAAGHQAARATRLVAFLALFLPLAGPPALAVSVLHLAWIGTTTGLLRRRRQPATAHQAVQ